MIQDGEFREDLYCRLAVLTVETTPLRDRREDTIGTRNPVVVTFRVINPHSTVNINLRAASQFHAANIRAQCLFIE